MNVYIDLSAVMLLMEIMVCIYGIESLMIRRLKKGVKITLIIVNFIMFFTIYLSYLTSFIIFFIFNFLVFKLLDNNQIKSFILFLILFFIINFSLNVLSNDISMKNVYLVVNNPYGILYIILVPLFGLFIYFSTRLVDNLYHLHSFKTQCIVTLNQKRYLINGYYDSGNTLKYNNVPVVFCNQVQMIEEINEYVLIEVKTINGIIKYKGYKALINIDHNQEEFFIYLVVVKNNESFNGCDLLLNAYLMR